MSEEISVENALSIPEGQISLADLRSLVPAQSTALAEAKSETGGGSFLPYISLTNGLSKACSRADNPQPQGIFLLMRGKEETPLGRSFSALFITLRVCAIDFNTDARSYDKNSDEYKSIKSRADGGTKGLGYGPEFLVYLPDQNLYAQYGCFSPTARNTAATILEAMASGPVMLTQQARRIESKKNGNIWWGPESKACSLDAPSLDGAQLKGILDSFMNPKEAVAKDKVEEGEAVTR